MDMSVYLSKLRAKGYQEEKVGLVWWRTFNSRTLGRQRQVDFWARWLQRQRQAIL